MVRQQQNHSLVTGAGKWWLFAAVQGNLLVVIVLQPSTWHWECGYACLPAGYLEQCCSCLSELVKGINF